MASGVASAALLGACGGDQADRDWDDWKIVEAYVTLDAAWHEKPRRVVRVGGSAERGPHPDITLAVHAARDIVAQGDHPKRLEAAEFLIEHPQGLSSTEAEDAAIGRKALLEHIGADWDVVERYQNLAYAAHAFEETGPAPHRAVAAAAAILNEPDHLRGAEAAAFLVTDPSVALAAVPYAAQALGLLVAEGTAANALAALRNIGAVRQTTDELGTLFERIASEAEDPVVKATARYFQAAGLMHSANREGGAGQPALRQRAIEAATGLSADVEEQAFAGLGNATNFLDAEQKLLHTLRHTMVGGTVAPQTGRRLDGGEEPLAAYAGKVMLIDFWATWCGPCISALPTLRRLHAELPPEHFALLGISTDSDVQTVLDFRLTEPMPWALWHADASSELVRGWDVTGFPTYVLVDADGTILERGHQLEGRLIKALREAVSHSAAASAARSEAGAQSEAAPT